MRDVIQLGDHRVFMVDNCGFKQLAQNPIIHISQGIYTEQGDPFHSFTTLEHPWEQDTVIETINLNCYYLEICQMLNSPEVIYQRLRSYK